MLEFTLKYWAVTGSTGRLSWKDRSCADDEAGSDSGSVKLPPMLRRRLSPLGKLALSAALEALPDEQPLPVVFASRHGDASRTLELLQATARGDALSPTAFSLSVHNAVAGIFSIARRDVSAVTAIASSDNLLLAALLEGAAQLSESPRVLCLLCDAPVPEFYRVESSAREPWALALVLESRTNRQDSGYRLTRAVPDTAGPALTSPLDLLPLLQGNTVSLLVEDGEAPWVLTRCEDDDVGSA